MKIDGVKIVLVPKEHRPFVSVLELLAVGQFFERLETPEVKRTRRFLFKWF